MPTLADLYSAIGTARRKASDLIQNPMTSLQQMAGNANDRARVLNEMTAAAAQEQDLYGPASKALGAKLAEAYNPIGVTFMTGKPISFPFIKNTEKAPQFHKYGEDKFGQLIEPHGNYISSAHDVDVSKLPKNYTHGIMEFKNPLVIDWGEGLYTDPDNWKQVLSKQYGGKKGKALSKAIAKDGYDGIVTMQGENPSEIVDLTRFLPSK
jgi:hypothetical protein